MTTDCLTRQNNDEETAALTASMIRDHLPVIFEHLPAGVIILNKHGNIIGYNEAARDLLGEPLFAQSWWQVIQRAFQHCDDNTGDLRLEDGRVVNLQTCPMKEKAGQIILCQEMTEIRALEGRIKRYQQLNETGELAARLAHQIRTPLSAALLYCDQLIEIPLPEEKRLAFMKKIKVRLHNIESHVKDMMMLVNVPMLHEFRKTDMHEFARMLRQHVDVSVIHIDDSRLKKVFCQCHVSSLIGAIQNCINNAVAAKATLITVQFFVVQNDDQTESCHISIRDNGKGMPPSVCEQACQPFYTTKKQGTGLGLAVVRSVCRAHHGSVKLHSNKDCGTEVTLTIPIMEQS